MSFWDSMKERAIAKEVVRMKHRVRPDNIGTITEEMKNHPDWVRDATQKKYTDLTIKTTDRVKKKQQEELTRRDKTRQTKKRNP